LWVREQLSLARDFEKIRLWRFVSSGKTNLLPTGGIGNWRKCHAAPYHRRTFVVTDR